MQCPNCGREHDKDWAVQFDRHSEHHFYKKLKCSECSYVVFLKLEFITSGHIDV